MQVTVVSQPGDAAVTGANGADGVGATYPAGAVLRLTAVPLSTCTLAGWGSDPNGKTNPIQFTVQGPMTITARFAKSAHQLCLPAVKKP